MAQSLENLRSVFLQTLDQRNEVRREGVSYSYAFQILSDVERRRKKIGTCVHLLLITAEKQLQVLRVQPSHPLQCLQLVSQCTAPQDSPIRQAVAVHFKNLVKNFWDEEKDDSVKISPSDRALIKTHLVDLMCTVPPAIQVQCSESIALIAAVDFPEQWDNLLPELISKFTVDGDLENLNGVLLTASSIFKRFRYVQRNDALYRDILYVLQKLAEPMLKLFQMLTKSVEQHQGNVQLLNNKLKALRTLCRIFFSLNWQDLPEFFEDHMGEWMECFSFFLKYENVSLVDPDEEDEPTTLDRLQAAVVDNLNLYVSKDEEPFLPHLPNFTTLVWGLLLKTTILPKHDVLAVTCIRFLSSLVGKLMHKSLFDNESTLREIIGKIVVPNLQIRETDEERFEDDPADFIMTDMEGSDSNSRRKCAQDLLKSMSRQFESQATSICLEHITTMLNDYNTDKTNKWGSKDVAIHLFLSSAVQAESATSGVSAVNDKLDVMDFFVQNILPELQQTNGHAMLNATAIKFATTFRNQFTTEHLTALMPLLIKHLSSSSVVVHTYAAAGIEKVLVTKKQIDIPTKETKFGQKELKQFLEPLFTGLFSIVDNEELSENEYVMKAVMRSLSVARDDLVAVTEIVLNKLTASLGRVAKNPKNPYFNHYLFESIAVLVKSVCSKNPEYTSAFEALLFPPFQHVLQMEVLEFTPYVFQVLAQLLEYRPDGLSDAYSSLFGPLMTPSLWESKGNVPGLTRLVTAYLLKGAPQLIAQNHLMPILGVFQKLISSKANETNGFLLLEAIIMYAPMDSIRGVSKDIFQVLLVRLQSAAQNKQKNARYFRLVSNYFSLFAGKYGAQAFVEQLDAIQQGIALTLLKQFWLPPLVQSAPSTKMDAKINIVGLTKILCESPSLLARPDGQEIWGDILFAIVQAASSVGTGLGSNNEDDFVVEVSYDSAYSKLHFASKPVTDPFPEVPDVMMYMVKSLQALCSSQPGKFPPLIKNRLEMSSGKEAAILQSMMQKAGVNLV